MFIGFPTIGLDQLNNDSWRLSVKQCRFIRTNNEAGSIFVPMPNSWERHQWLKGYFGKECSVVGRVLWSLLTYEYEVMVLIEENGIFREEKKE
tara:strand:- start:4298 stop:4576 length:279 start_codon:yes stop_codon:yes gene_type:complete